jgi:collagenase-like PrtC family protease
LFRSPPRREDIEYVERIFALFRQAIDAIGRQPAGE